MKHIKIFMLLVVMMIASSAFAQGKFMVAGTVMDENGGPLIGVTVKCTDKSVGGVVTDLDGKFRVKDIPNNAVLEFTYLGYKKFTYKVNYSKEGVKVVMRQVLGYCLSKCVSIPSILFSLSIRFLFLFPVFKLIYSSGICLLCFLHSHSSQ